MSNGVVSVKQAISNAENFKDMAIYFDMAHEFGKAGTYYADASLNYDIAGMSDDAHWCEDQALYKLKQIMSSELSPTDLIVAIGLANRIKLDTPRSYNEITT